MAQDIWIGIEDSGGLASGWRFDGAAVVAAASGASVAEVQAQLGDAPALIVAEGEASQPVPAAILPGTLPLAALTQARPQGYLDAPARLRIAGAVAARTNWDGVICLPMAGVTHWCQISADEVVSFQSALTPMLARTLGAAQTADPEALADTMSRPERLSLHLRSAGLAGAPEAVAGHLLGAELAAMRPYWLGQQVIVIAQSGLYADALALQGVPVETLHPSDAARDGLRALRGKTR
jgi:2-dehydro-3-deoxygalactonokinase